MTSATKADLVLIGWLGCTCSGCGRTNDIDHKDCHPDNNRWANLREATRSQNCANTGPRRNNTSGFKGVSFHRVTGKWSATIRCAGHQQHLGLFVTPEEAAAVYQHAATRLFGEFARVAA